MSLKKKYFNIDNPYNLEKITKVFFNQRRKMIKKPLNKIFNKTDNIIKKLELNLNLRPQNLSPETYFKITREYENLIKQYKVELETIKIQNLKLT